MEKAIKDLRECENSTDLSEIKRCLNVLRDRSIEATEAELSEYAIDHTLKCILRNNPSVEILDKIEDLLTLVRDPRNFYDELDHCISQRHLTVPTLMLVHEIRKHYNFEYEEFYTKLESTVSKENLYFEGYLLFLLKALQDRKIDESVVVPIIKKLCVCSVEISSSACIRVLYSVIVILRMHPGCFKAVPLLGQLYILLNSFDSISRIARRIFLEAENPHMRPPVVFLENFVFPTLTDE